MDVYLRESRFGQQRAELTTKSYAGSLALYLRWCERTGRDWREAASEFGLFITWLKYTPGGDETTVVAGPGVKQIREARRINGVLSAVRGFLTHEVQRRHIPAWVMSQLYEISDDSDLPFEARGEDSGLTFRLKARHRLHEEEEPVDRASDEEIVAMLGACRSARDRLIVLLMARVGLRRGEVAGLRREDMHFLMDSSVVGCGYEGAHLHVVRRQNSNGAWAKSRRQRIMPVDFLVVQAFDQYAADRAVCSAARDSDYLLVNLTRGPIGSGIRPGAVNELVTALARRAGITRSITPHMCRHAFASNVTDAGGSADELQTLMGHKRPSSGDPYRHPNASRLRDAVDRVPTPRLPRGGE
ncbi:tyrosine-type recombinase/integrase [Streptomyces sp. ISL-44]|uniref:tyrosine-type recombinase/integrase n=1 Tax=Streptomyces sp. ISL-44 TaxID=2819184 RepID=UPI0027E24348|nr:tyrosine-type recombinase/integrase [Streptomyces sp. ISL-44]